MSEFSLYSSVLFIHVTSAVILIGSTLYAPLAHNQVRAANSLADLRRSLDLAVRASKWNPAAAFVLLGTGIYLGSVGWWTQPWFYVSIAAWIADTTLAVAVIGRHDQAMAVIAGRDDENGPVPVELDAVRQSRAWGLAHAAMLANDLAILYVMFNKPDLTGSVALVLAANALALGVATRRAGAKGNKRGEWSEPQRLSQ